MRLPQLRLRGGPAVPANPGTPVPATVEMMPVFASTFRITWLSRSAMYRFPAASNTISCGTFSDASIAGPPSPEYPFVPVPANVDVRPVFKSSRRIRWFPRSQKYNAPSGPIARPYGSLTSRSE